MACCADFYKTISNITCRSLMAVELFEIWVPEFDSTGQPNKISLADAKLLANWITKINASGSKNKFYILPQMDNIVDERADAVFETLDSGVNIKTKQGDRDFTGYFIQEPNCVLSEVEAWEKAGTWGKYVVDKDGNILYRYCSTDADYIYPIMVDEKSLDAKLVKLAKLLGAKIFTNDFNLNKVAELQGVRVLNINELANALKPVVLPGELMQVKLVKEGKEHNQAIAYLDDGTMVVVEEGKGFLGKAINVLVTSVLQTAAGRMIFAKLESKK